MLDFDSSRILLPTSPMMPYKPTSAREVVQKGLHFGQRKLMLSELEYLVPILKRAGSSQVLVVYAGAANGLHLPFLFSCFPNCKFILIDPAPFCDELENMFKNNHPQLLDLIHDCCTDDICARIRQQFTEYAIHFISDIRSGNPPDLTNYEHTQLINKDNEMQRGWCVALGASSAMLKFHPPYPAQREDDLTPESVRYVPGTMLWGVWGPKSTTEVRLVATAPFESTHEYNCLEHEQQCYYYNTTSRYKSDVLAETIIIRDFLQFSDVYKSESVVSFSKLLSEKLLTPEFQPLSPSFSEIDGRTFALLYYARCPKIAEYFSEWRTVLSPEMLVAWSSGGPLPPVRDFVKYAYRKTLMESFNVAPPKRARV